MQAVQRFWTNLFDSKHLCGYNPLALFPPLSDLYTFVIIAAMLVWTFLAVMLFDPEDIPFDLTAAVAILSGTLGFLLPSQLSAALSKNKSGLDNYNALCGDVMALGWQFVSFNTDERDTEDLARIDAIFDILKVLPLAVKWHYRGGLQLSKLEVSNSNGVVVPFINTAGGQAIQQLKQRVRGEGMAEIEIMFYKLVDYIREFELSGKARPVNVLMTKWNNVYGSWGNMGNLTAYKPPSIFSNILNVALVLYIVMLPLTFLSEGYHAVWIVGIVGYFFLGLNMAGRIISNPFAEGGRGFQTVTASQKTMTTALVQVYELRNDIQATPVVMGTRINFRR